MLEIRKRRMKREKIGEGKNKFVIFVVEAKGTSKVMGFGIMNLMCFLGKDIDLDFFLIKWDSFVY